MDNARRLNGWLFSLVIVLMCSISLGRAEAETVPAKTTIHDIVYRADGTTAAGTLLISWPAFTTADGATVAAGTLTQALSPGGALDVALVPNTGATPSGVYYTVTFHLDDRKPYIEYWLVPSASSAKISEMRSKIVPQSVAFQAASRDYVVQSVKPFAQDTAVVHRAGNEDVQGAKNFTVAPTVPLPQSGLEAANKSYVDGAVRNITVDATNLISKAPAIDQVISQPNGTSLKVNRISATVLNGMRFADQYPSIQAAITDAGTTGAVTIPPGYSGTDSYSNPNSIPIVDQRKAGRQAGFINLVTECGVSELNSGAANNAAIAACFAAFGKRTYRFPGTAAAYSFASTINFDIGGGILECEGSAALGDWGSAVRLNFPADTAGVSMSGTGGQKFRGCRLVSSSPWSFQNASTYIIPYGMGGANTAALKADCVQVRGHGIEVADTSCEYFGRHGVNIDGGEFGGNQNQWRVRNIRAYGNRGAGLHIKGGDTNIGKSEGIDASYNQFGAILDESFLGNVHLADHADGNHYDGTVVSSTCAISNKVRSSNITTLTCPAHGFSPMDTISITYTSGLFDGLWTVFATPDANNFQIKQPGSDIVSSAQTGNAGRTAAFDKWRFNASGCSINSSSTTLTCAAGFESSMKWDLISIPGAGASGAALNTWITAVGSATSVVLGTAASTTVSSGGTAAVALNGPQYKLSGQAQFGCALIASYSEGSGGFGASQVSDKCLVLGGDHGAGWDSTTGAANPRHDPSTWYGGITARPADNSTGLGTAIAIVRNLGNSSIIDYDNNSGSLVESHRFDFTDAALTIKDSRANGPSISLNKTGSIQMQAKAGQATSINYCNGCTGDIQIADGAASPANTILLKGSLGRGIFNGGAVVNTTTAKPTCAVGVRGLFWVTQGAAGVKDSVEVCAKDATDSYAWRLLY